MCKLSMVAVGALCILALFVASAYGQETVTLTVNSAHGSPVLDPPGPTYAVPSVVTASVATPVAGGADIQYVCIGWKAKGSQPTNPQGYNPPEILAMGWTNSVTFTIDSNVVLTWRWKTQYMLTLNVEPHLWAGHINFYCDSHPEEPSGTYPPTQGGYWTYLRVAQLTAVADRDYVFDHWSGGSQVLRLEPFKNPTVQKLRRPEVVTAVFVPTTHYTLTIVSEYGDPQGAGTYDPGEIRHWSVTSPWPGDTGVQYVALGDTEGDTAPMYENITITVNWKTQYFLTTAVSAGMGDVLPTPPGKWCDVGDEPVQASPAEDWGFAGWTGPVADPNAMSTTVTMDGPKSIAASFFQPTLEIINDSARDNPNPAVGLYTKNYGESVTASITSPIGGIQYSNVTEGFEGGVLPPGWTTYNTPWTFTAAAAHDGSKGAQSGMPPARYSYSDLRSPTYTVGPGGGTVSFWWRCLTGSTSNYLYFYLDGSYYTRIRSTVGWTYVSYSVGQGSHYMIWEFYRASSTVPTYAHVDTVTVTNVETAAPKYAVTGYVGTGSCPAGPGPLESHTSVTFTITQNSTITWDWKLANQVPLTVYNPTGADSPVPAAGATNFEYGSAVTCSVTSPAPYYSVGTFTEGFESGMTGWTTGGTANWFVTTPGQDGTGQCVRSGAITHSQNTYIERTFLVGGGGGTLTFWWNVDSEKSYDFLEFWLDGVKQAAISGLGTASSGGADTGPPYGWEFKTYSLTEGSHTLRWNYVKDSSWTELLDCGYLDDVTVTNASGGSTPGIDYVCTGYTGTGSCPTGPGKTVTFYIRDEADHLPNTITWNWEVRYKLTTAIAPAGTGTVTGDPAGIDGYYLPDTGVTLTAHPAEGYTFAYWSAGLSGDVVQHQYAFINQAKTWQAAKADCQARGGYLVTISSAAENALVTSLVPPNMAAWIGFTDEAVEGNFVWVTGEPVVYTNWAGGEPNNDQGALGEDYAELYTYSGIEGLWNDDHSDVGWERPYVCEFEVKTPPASIGFDPTISIVMDSPKGITAHFAGPNMGSGFAGLGTSTSAIAWRWTSDGHDWQSIAAGLLRTVFATMGSPLPDSATCPRDGSRVLLGMNVSGAVSYTIAYTKLSETTWTCTADTNMTALKDFYIDETGVLREAMSTGDGLQAGSGSDVSPDDVGWEIHKVAPVGDPVTVYPNITSWQETGLDENAQYTRHVHAYNDGVYSAASNDGSRYTLIRDASEFTVAASFATYTKGTSTSTYTKSYPIDISYNYARCQILLYGSELGMGGMPGKITKIRFQRASGDDDTVNNVTMHMANTSAGGIFSWTDTSGMTQVFSGNLSIPAAGSGTWYEIVLGTPFNYDGSSNLLISFRHQDGSAEGTYTTWYTYYPTGPWAPQSACRCVQYYSNTVDPPTEPSGQNDPWNSSSMTYLPNVQLDVQVGAVIVNVTPPPNSTAGMTGVRIERGGTVVQDYAPTYTKLDAPLASGTYSYTIRFCNGDGVPSAYSAPKTVTVP